MSQQPTPQQPTPRRPAPQELPALTLTWARTPSDLDVADAVALLAAAAAADGTQPISDAASLRLRHHGRHQGAGLHLLARATDGQLIGYAGVDQRPGVEHQRSERRTVEFAVHPAHRRRGIGGVVLDAVLERLPGPLWIWAHGEHPAALRLAERAGLQRRRELLQLRRTLTEPLPPRSLPDGLRLRSFVPGQDESAVVRVNNLAFDWHPEQGHWGVDELVLRESEPWFDPAGFLLAVDAQDRVHGFHWTKVHPRGLGEIYVIGVDPATQGSGLGGALIVAGLEYLRGRGMRDAMLYVESDNAAALATYRKLGFQPYRTDVEFLRPAPTPRIDA